MSGWNPGDRKTWTPRRWLLAGAIAAVLAGLTLYAGLGGKAVVSGETPEERAACIGRIVDQEQRGAEGALAGAVGDPSARVREAALAGLGRLRCREDLLRAGLRDRDASVRYAAALGLGRMGTESAARELAEAVQTGADVQTRVGAVEGLGRVGTARAVVCIAKALDAPDAQVQVAAMNTLSAMADIRWDKPPDPRNVGEWGKQVDLIRRTRMVRKALAEGRP